jgi:hypothetical protein
VEWPARRYFHVMLNSTMGDELVVELILVRIEAVQKA